MYVFAFRGQGYVNGYGYVLAVASEWRNNKVFISYIFKINTFDQNAQQLDDTEQRHNT